jgi:hypothetical protein
MPLIIATIIVIIDAIMTALTTFPYLGALVKLQCIDYLVFCFLNLNESAYSFKLAYPSPGLVVRLQPLSHVGMGSIPIQVASIYERMSSLYTLVWGSGPMFTKSCLKQSRIFLIKFLKFALIKLIIMLRNS